MNRRRINLLINKELKKNQLELKLILKNAKITSNIIDNRNKIRQNLNNKILLREKRSEKAKINSDLKIKRKIYLIRNRQMIRDIRDIETQFQKINPFINKDLKRINNEQDNRINYYINNKLKYIDELKNKYYEKNYPLEKINYVINDVDNLYEDFIVNDNKEKYNYNNYDNYYINLPVITNKYYKNEIINNSKNNENDNNMNNNKEYYIEKEKRVKLKKIMDSYKKYK